MQSICIANCKHQWPPLLILFLIAIVNVSFCFLLVGDKCYQHPWLPTLFAQRPASRHVSPLPSPRYNPENVRCYVIQQNERLPLAHYRRPELSLPEHQVPWIEVRYIILSRFTCSMLCNSFVYMRSDERLHKLEHYINYIIAIRKLLMNIYKVYHPSCLWMDNFIIWRENVYLHFCFNYFESNLNLIN